MTRLLSRREAVFPRKPKLLLYLALLKLDETLLLLNDCLANQVFDLTQMLLKLLALGFHTQALARTLKL